MTTTARLRRMSGSHPRLARSAARLARRLGAVEASDKLFLASFDVPRLGAIVRIPLPERFGERRSRLLMFDAEGADQIVRAFVSSGWSGFERPLPDVFATYVAKLGGLVLDVGANTGFYALLACTVRADVSVRAFEPYPPGLDRLQVNIELNNYRARIGIEQAAVSDSEGVAELFVPSPDHGLVETSCTLNPSFKDDFVSSVPVSLTTLDASVGDDERVSIVKIDVESFEAQVLRGGRRLLERHRPHLFIEVLPVGDSTGIDTLRAELDYVDVRLRPNEALIGANVQFDGNAWNHLLVPAERVSDALAILHESGLSVRHGHDLS